MMKNSTYTLDLLQALELASPVSCKIAATSIHSICPRNQPRRKKNPGRRSNSQPIVLYCLGLHMQNPGLREVDLEPSPKIGSEKINKQRPKKINTTESKLYPTARTHKQESCT